MDDTATRVAVASRQFSGTLVQQLGPFGVQPAMLSILGMHSEVLQAVRPQLGPPSVASTTKVLPGKAVMVFASEASVEAKGVPPLGGIAMVRSCRYVHVGP